MRSIVDILRGDDHRNILDCIIYFIDTRDMLALRQVCKLFRHVGRALEIRADLFILMDVTSSMCSVYKFPTYKGYIEMLKKCCIKTNTEVSFGVFWDHLPIKESENSFIAVTEPVTEPVTELVAEKIDSCIVETLYTSKYFLKDQKYGGNDEAEAFADGFQLALMHPWRKNSKKLVILLTDAFPHGYPHNRSSPADMFLSGCPCGLNIENIYAQFSLMGIKIAQPHDFRSYCYTKELDLPCIMNGTEDIHKILEQVYGPTTYQHIKK